MIRVLLAEDHLMVRAGIERLLQATDDIEVVGLACDGVEAVAFAQISKPDVVVMDLSMPNLGGAAATRQLLQIQPEVKVLILSSFSDRERIVEAIDSGAIGFILKDGDPDDLVKAIRAASRGESPLDPRAARVILERRQELKPVVHLTSREEEVLALVAEGLSNKLVARSLGISEKTVKTHLTRIFQTIGVSDRTQAALWLRRNNSEQ